ncbi:hypothetical protein B0H14DRAFT_3157084, partial [Mycena olivaceomarginata]
MEKVRRMSEQVREIKNKRRKVRQKGWRTPKTVEVREDSVKVRKDNVQVRRKLKFSQPSVIHPVIDADAPDSIPLRPSSRPAPAFVLTRRQWMSGPIGTEAGRHSSGWLTLFSGRVCSRFRQPPHVSSAPAPAVFSSFGIPTTESASLSIAAQSINLTEFGNWNPHLYPDLFHVPGVWGGYWGIIM